MPSRATNTFISHGSPYSVGLHWAPLEPAFSGEKSEHYSCILQNDDIFWTNSANNIDKNDVKGTCVSEVLLKSELLVYENAHSLVAEKISVNIFAIEENNDFKNEKGEATKHLYALEIRNTTAVLCTINMGLNENSGKFFLISGDGKILAEDENTDDRTVAPCSDVDMVVHKYSNTNSSRYQDSNSSLLQEKIACKGILLC
jgi:hypothetical protein